MPTPALNQDHSLNFNHFAKNISVLPTWPHISAQCDRAITVSVHSNLSVSLSVSSHLTFQETKRPSKEMQVTIARQLGLDPSTVSNFFMNARRRSVDKWREDSPPSSPPPVTRTVYVGGGGSGQSELSLSPASLSSPHLDLWQDLGVAAADHAPSAAHTCVYIIPRSLVTRDSSGAESEQVAVLDNDQDDHEEILETDEEVLDDDDCLEPPD